MTTILRFRRLALLLLLPAALAAQEKEYPELEPFLQRAGGLDRFLEDNPKAGRLREEYFEKLQDYHGKERFTGEHFERLLFQYRRYDQQIQTARIRQTQNAEVSQIMSTFKSPEINAMADLIAKYERKPPSDPKVLQALVEEGLTLPDDELKERVRQLIIRHGLDSAHVHLSLQNLVLDHPDPRVRVYAANIVRFVPKAKDATLSMARSRLKWFAKSDEKIAASRAIALVGDPLDPKRAQALNAYASAFGAGDESYLKLSEMIAAGDEHPELILELYRRICVNREVHSCGLSGLQERLESYLKRLKITTPADQLKFLEQIKHLESDYIALKASETLLRGDPKHASIALSLVSDLKNPFSTLRPFAIRHAHRFDFTDGRVRKKLNALLKGPNQRGRLSAALILSKTGSLDPKVHRELIDQWFAESSDKNFLPRAIDDSDVLKLLEKEILGLDLDSPEILGYFLDKLKKDPDNIQARMAFQYMERPSSIHPEDWQILTRARSRQREVRKAIGSSLKSLDAHRPSPCSLTQLLGGFLIGRAR